MGIGSALVIICAAAGVFLWLTATATPESKPHVKVHVVARSAESEVSLRVKDCPSSYGLSGTPATGYPTSIKVTLPAGVANEVSFYSDSARSVQPILGPKQWGCSVSVGADGSTIVTIFPPGISDPISGTSTASGTPANAQLVTAYSPSACQGCIADLVCSVFPGAMQQLGYAGQPCPSLPPGEIDTFSSGSAAAGFGTVGFTDPPGVKGTGSGSGGTYPAIGTLRFGTSTGSNEASAAVLTCILPASDGAICQAVNQDFVSQNWGFSSAPSAPPPTTGSTAPVTTTPNPDPLSTTATIDQALQSQIAQDQATVNSDQAAVSQEETQLSIDESTESRDAYACSQDEAVPSLSADATFECGLEAQDESTVATATSQLAYANAGLSDAEQTLQTAESGAGSS